MPTALYQQYINPTLQTKIGKRTTGRQVVLRQEYGIARVIIIKTPTIGSKDQKLNCPFCLIQMNATIFT